MVKGTVLRSFTVMELRVLRQVETGHYPSKAARILGIKKQLMNYYLNRFRRWHLVRKQRLGKISEYQLTDEGKRILTGGERRVVGRRFRLHGFGFCYPLVVQPRVGVDWGRLRRVDMRNWEKWLGRLFNVSFEFTPRSLIVYPEPIEGADPHELVFQARDLADTVARELEQRFEMKLGLPSYKGKPSWAVYDPAAERFTEHMNVVVHDVGGMDRSPPLCDGEIEWSDPDVAKDYLLQPIRIRSIQQSIGPLIEALNKFAVQFDRHYSVMDRQEKAVAAIEETLRKFTGLLEVLVSNLDTGKPKPASSSAF